MKRLILTIAVVLIMALLSGCTPLTPQQQAANRAAWQAFMQGMQQQNSQAMYNAQYNYYTRPYKVGNVTYVPYRR